MIKLAPGSVIRFTYNHPPEGVDEGTGDRFKEVLVLCGNWHGKMHGIDLKRCTSAEREVLRLIFDEKTVAAAKAGKSPSRLPLVNDVLRRMNPIEDIKQPLNFYSRFVRPFIRTAGDVYRTYWPTRMSAVSVVKKTDVTGKQINTKPMFGDRNVFAPSEPKKPEPTAKPLSRLDLIRQRALKNKKPK